MTLFGPGGVGKTRLAAAVAHVNAGAFGDGVAFGPLVPVRAPGLVGSAMALADVRAGAHGSEVPKRLKLPYLHGRRKHCRS